MIVNIPLLVLLGFAADKIAYVISQAEILAPLRGWVGKQAYPGMPDRYTGCWVWFHKLITCIECTGVWVSMPAAVFPVLDGNGLLVSIVEIAATAGVATLIGVPRRTIQVAIPDMVNVVSHSPVYEDNKDV